MMRPCQIARIVSWIAIVAACVGCGGRERADVDRKPFEAAIVEYCRVNSMGMKPDTFESLEVAESGDRAVAKVRMATADDLYGMKPLWTITFRREGEAWVVAGAER